MFLLGFISGVIVTIIVVFLLFSYILKIIADHNPFGGWYEDIFYFNVVFKLFSIYFILRNEIYCPIFNFLYNFLDLFSSNPWHLTV